MENDSSVDGRPASLRHGVESRLEFLEFRLYWDGRVNRSDLTERFGISINQASADLSRYQALAPENLAYDKSAKHYRATPAFRPRFLVPDANRYLAQLRLLADRIVGLEDTLLTTLPPFEIAATPFRPVDPEILRQALAAIGGGQAIRVLYQSMSRPEPLWRWIEPHALGFDGFRWHLRAWCRTRQRFSDFVLARIHETGGVEPALVARDQDAEWAEWVTLEIAPHPGLSSSQQAAIARDYGMTGQTLALRVRRALLLYVRRRLRLDLPPDLQSPREQRIILTNRAEIDRLIVGAGIDD